MRDYRKRQRAETAMNTTVPADAVRQLVDCEDEVKRLKRELAKRPPDGGGPTPGFEKRALTPVTPFATPLRDRLLGEARRDRQKVIDEALRKVNRTAKKP